MCCAAVRNPAGRARGSWSDRERRGPSSARPLAPGCSGGPSPRPEASARARPREPGGTSSPPRRCSRSRSSGPGRTSSPCRPPAGSAGRRRSRSSPATCGNGRDLHPEPIGRFEVATGVLVPAFSRGLLGQDPRCPDQPLDAMAVHPVFAHALGILTAPPKIGLGILTQRGPAQEDGRSPSPGCARPSRTRPGRALGLMPDMTAHAAVRASISQTPLPLTPISVPSSWKARRYRSPRQVSSRASFKACNRSR